VSEESLLYIERLDITVDGEEIREMDLMIPEDTWDRFTLFSKGN